MGRHKKNFNTIIDNIVDQKVGEKLESAIEESVEKKLDEDDVDPNNDPSSNNENSGKKTDFLNTLLKPKNGTYYKIYKVKPLQTGCTQPILMTDITGIDLDGCDDIEVYIRDLAKSGDWGPGEYLIREFCKKDGRTELKGMGTKINITYPQSPKRLDNNNDLKGTTGLSEAVSILREAKDLLNPPQDSVSMGKVIADTFRAGIEVMKESIQKPDSSKNSILETLAVLKELGLGYGERKDKSQSPEELIVLLKTMGLFKDDKPDVFSEIKKLRDLGIIKLSSEEKVEDPINSISKVLELIKTISPLVGSGDQTTSPSIELIRILGPQMPGIIENITGTINQVAEISKMKISARMGVRPHEMAKPPEKMVEKIENIGEVIQQRTIEMPKARNPLIEELLRAVNDNDQEFFTRLQELMTIYINQNIIDTLVDGSVSIDIFLSSLSQITKEPELRSEKVKTYLQSFLDWHQAGNVIAECQNCHEEFVYDGEQAFDDDNKLCSCGGTLQLQGK